MFLSNRDKNLTIIEASDTDDGESVGSWGFCVRHAYDDTVAMTRVTPA
ncbi:hypothetical protein SAMN04489841_3554 [Natrinema salaciae]|uniref:Uncharacterized protein n=1 Tax=Natrinema salaciae TaxID=1186196 RepID=A0A1H9MYE8_9EURY|nr:hypothetical protein SAMN04489841_3554 [Natrinema salaciae]